MYPYASSYLSHSDRQCASTLFLYRTCITGAVIAAAWIRRVALLFLVYCIMIMHLLGAVLIYLSHRACSFSPYCAWWTSVHALMYGT